MTSAQTRIIVDSSDSRAFRQAILDWRHETSKAPTRRAAMAIHWRSIVGLGRLSTLVLLKETMAAVTSGWAWWMLAWIALPIAINHWTLSRSDAHAYAEAALADYQILSQLVPICVFLALATGRRRSAPPLVGLIALMVGVRVLVAKLGWSVVWHYMVHDNAARWLHIFNGHAPSPAFVSWGWVAISMAQPAALILLGDRIRADRLRGVLLPVSMAVWVFLYVGMILGRVPSPNPVLLRHPAYASWFWLSRLWFGSFVFAPLITIALWALLVWRQTARSEKALSAA